MWRQCASRCQTSASQSTHQGQRQRSARTRNESRNGVGQSRNRLRHSSVLPAMSGSAHQLFTRSLRHDRNSATKSQPECNPVSFPLICIEHYTNLMQQFIALRVVNDVATMSATISDSRLGDLAKGQAIPVVFNNKNLFCRISVQAQERRCPTCDSIVYSRRHSRCGVCEQVLPTNCLFDPDESAKVDVLLRTERQRHKAWLTKIEVGRCRFH